MALQAQLDWIVAQAAKDMERAQEKAMSVEYGIKEATCDVVPTKEKSKEREQAKTRSRGRGLSLGW
jgi:hypothetical protein